MPIKHLTTNEVTYAGCVLWVGDRYQGHDHYQDYVRVWDGSKVVEVVIGSGYCDQTMRVMSAQVDATDEVKELVKKWEQEEDRKASERRLAYFKEQEAKKKLEIIALQAVFDKAPERGASVIVVSGRNKRAKKGETGVVFWKGVNKFKPNKITVGVLMADGEKVYLDSTYVTLDLMDFLYKP